ncbi:MAG: DUF2283 domain-containing protein [Planctomycetes bacterium]|nr:DUF2283 domain-containing protein [Planctomycetota bacterium]
MSMTYYPETDSLYVDLSSKTSVESQEVSPGVVLDYDEDGNLVGIDIDQASAKLDLRELILDRMPAMVKKLTA